MANYSFDKSLRLLNAADYKAVFDDATLKVSSQQVLFLARPNSLNHLRLGLVITKKNVRLAVQRNRVKRAIRECFRLHQHQINAIDVIVLARRGADQLDNNALQQMLTELLHKLQNKACKTRRSVKATPELKTQTPPEG